MARVSNFLGPLFCFFCMFENCNALLSDRVLFLIGDQPFTQLELEHYLAVKHAFLERKVLKIDKQNWQTSLEDFAQDMWIVVGNESSLAPSQKSIDPEKNL